MASARAASAKCAAVKGPEILALSGTIIRVTPLDTMYVVIPGSSFGSDGTTWLTSICAVLLGNLSIIAMYLLTSSVLVVLVCLGLGVVVRVGASADLFRCQDPVILDDPAFVLWGVKTVVLGGGALTCLLCARLTLASHKLLTAVVTLSFPKLWISLNFVGTVTFIMFRSFTLLVVTILFGDGDFAALANVVIGGVGAAVVDELGGACSVGSFLGVEAALASDSSTSSMFVLAFFFLFLLGCDFGFRNDTNPHLVLGVMIYGILSGS